MHRMHTKLSIQEHALLMSLSGDMSLGSMPNLAITARSGLKWICPPAILMTTVVIPRSGFASFSLMTFIKVNDGRVLSYIHHKE
ncbi:hypothetical protein XENOCAPTIV_003054 [Xenoophorus captivus]|uniref:Uncharacterized protein n=1 Tax=Xenoophorus captivus TaxID=1517983 RepID=A0ABV0RYG1_9TELE